MSDGRPLGDLADILLADVGFPEAARRIAREMALALGADTALVFEVDVPAASAAMVAGYHVPPALRDPAYRFPFIAPPAFVAEGDASGSPVAIPDAAGDPRLDHPLMNAMPTRPRSLLYAPMMRGGQRIGGILAYWWTAPRSFTEADLRVAAAIAAQGALAVENHQLRRAADGHATVLARLLESTQVVASSLDLPAVLEAIADGALRLIGAQRCAVFELDPDAQLLRVRASRGMRPDQLFMPLRLGQGAAGSAARNRRLAFSPDIVSRPLPMYDEPFEGTGMTLRELVRKRGYRAILAMPLVSKDRVLGAVCIYWDEVHEYDEREVRLATGFAHQAAIAIENARLYSETARQAREAAILSEITRDISSSLELEAVLRKIIHYAREGCGSDMAFIAPYDPVERAATIVASVGTRTEAYTGVKILPGKGIGGKVLETGHPFLTEDYLHDPRLSQDYSALAEQEGFVVNMAVPIARESEILGVVWVVNRCARPFTDRDRTFLTNLADQAAVAIANARLYAEARRALAELQAKNAELDSFVYVVSHDLKAPLVTIQGMSDIVLEEQRDRLDADGQRYLERIQANVMQMERLIMDLLALSRIGREARPAQAVPLTEVVDDVLAELAGPIRERGIEVVRGELPTLVGVRTQLEQVLGNLLSNAVKYIGDGPAPRVEVGAVDHGHLVECFVRDSGIGIDPAYHQRVFEIFQRLKDVEVDGSGVGLTIVKKIVEGAGGRTWVESARGEGTTFRFTWPKAAAASSTAP
jgi:signal transduction histidine kinase